MKKTKMLLLLFVGLLFCGCAPYSYEIDFNQGVIQETITFDFDYDLYEAAEELADSDGQYSEYELVNNEIPALQDYSKNYSKVISKNGNGHIVNLNYRYDYDSFENNMFINSCFENAIYLNEVDYYYVKLYGDYTCFADRSFDINLTTHNKVISSNADNVSGNKLTWTMDIAKSTYDIEFQISKDTTYEKIDKSITAWQIIEIIVFVILLSGFISVAVIYHKTKKSR